MDKDTIIDLYNKINLINTSDEKGFIELLEEYIKDEDENEKTRDLVSNFLYQKPTVVGYSMMRIEHITNVLNYYIKKLEIAKVYKLIEKNGQEYKVFIALC